ncbi:MAG TPA: hypothetical protein VHN98_02145 [Acidimicrobiales bacterium]|nr:hypothetical protein [Acidimicrobiales bacterium]
MTPDARHERRHDPEAAPLWNESWYFDFAAPDGSLGGYVRLGLYPNLGVSWYWAYLVGDDRPLLVVRHHEAALPRGDVLEVREEGLWAALHCETPHEHWSVQLEAFAVGLDDPAQAYEPGGERGDRVPLGFDLEWEAAAPVHDTVERLGRYEQTCTVTGEILVGDERIELDGTGQRDHSWGVRDWWERGWIWTAGRAGDDAFHAFCTVPYGGWGIGYVAHDGALETVLDFEAHVESDDEDPSTRFPRVTAMRFLGLDLTCTTRHLAPVRLESPEGRVARFPRALCRFDAADGRSGYGWTEWNQPE